MPFSNIMHNLNIYKSRLKFNSFNDWIQQQCPTNIAIHCLQSNALVFTEREGAFVYMQRLIERSIEFPSVNEILEI